MACSWAESVCSGACAVKSIGARKTISEGKMPSVHAGGTPVTHITTCPRAKRPRHILRHTLASARETNAKAYRPTKSLNCISDCFIWFRTAAICSLPCAGLPRYSLDRPS